MQLPVNWYIYIIPGVALLACIYFLLFIFKITDFNSDSFDFIKSANGFFAILILGFLIGIAMNNMRIEWIIPAINCSIEKSQKDSKVIIDYKRDSVRVINYEIDSVYDRNIKEDSLIILKPKRDISRIKNQIFLQRHNPQLYERYTNSYNTCSLFQLLLVPTFFLAIIIIIKLWQNKQQKWRILKYFFIIGIILLWMQIYNQLLNSNLDYEISKNLKNEYLYNHIKEIDSLE